MLQRIRNCTWKFWLQISVLLLVFLVSVRVRSFNYDQPLGRHHEWISAHTLVTMKAWAERGGPEHFSFAPLYTFANEPDKRVGVLGGIEDAKGDMYYVSYPALAYLVPYYSLKIFNAGFTSANLQVFGYVLHLVTAMLFFFLLLHWTNGSLQSEFCLYPFLGFLMYVFAPGNLWFHSNVYFVDVLMQAFLFGLLYMFFIVYRKRAELSRGNKLILFGVIFLGIQTEWLALFMSFAFFVYVVFQWIRERKRQWFIVSLIISGATLASLSTTFLQYSSIAGSDKFIQASVDKFKMRSGQSAEKAEYGISMTNPESYKLWERHLINNYITIENIAGLALFCLVIAALVGRRYFFTREQLFLLFVLGGGVFLHLLVFFNFNALHDFGTLKVGSLMMVFAVFSFERMGRMLNDKGPKVYMVFSVAIVLLVAVKSVQSISIYQQENRLEIMNFANQNIGNAIREFAKPDEKVFIDVWPCPEIMYYAERNPLPEKELSNASKFLRDFGLEKGIFIRTNGGQSVTEIYRINNLGDSLRVGP